MTKCSSIKIVQSFWSKPFYREEERHFGDRSMGGWADRSHFYMSWALSCLRASTLYQRVELVTDTFGKQLFQETLQLPYTSVSIVLDDINHFHKDLWAIGKIYAYAHQEEPFVHIDGDVFLWKKLSEDLHNAPLVAQHEEYNYVYYHDTLKSLQQQGVILHPLIEKELASGNPVIASNAGVIGGQNFGFFKSLQREALLFINQNQHVLTGGFSTGLFNNIYEQYLFNRLANAERIPIKHLFENISYNYEGLCDFHKVPSRSSFIHVIGIYKRKFRNGEMVSALLKHEFPEYHQKLSKLLADYVI